MSASLERAQLAALIEIGACTPEVALELHQQRQASREAIGRLLVKVGVLTMEQAVEVHQAHRAEPDIRFGQVAVELGFCSREAIDRALGYQETALPTILQLASEHDEVDQRKLASVVQRRDAA